MAKSQPGGARQHASRHVRNLLRFVDAEHPFIDSRQTAQYLAVPQCWNSRSGLLGMRQTGRKETGAEAALDPRDVGGEEVDGTAVQVAAGSVVVLSGARIGMASEDLRVPQRDAGVEGIGDGGVSE